MIISESCLRLLLREPLFERLSTSAHLTVRVCTVRPSRILKNVVEHTSTNKPFASHKSQAHLVYAPSYATPRSPPQDMKSDKNIYCKKITMHELNPSKDKIKFIGSHFHMILISLFSTRMAWHDHTKSEMMFRIQTLITI